MPRASRRPSRLARPASPARGATASAVPRSQTEARAEAVAAGRALRQLSRQAGAARSLSLPAGWVAPEPAPAAAAASPAPAPATASPAPLAPILRAYDTPAEREILRTQARRDTLAPITQEGMARVARERERIALWNTHVWRPRPGMSRAERRTDIAASLRETFGPPGRQPEHALDHGFGVRPLEPQLTATHDVTRGSDQRGLPMAIMMHNMLARGGMSAEEMRRPRVSVLDYFVGNIMSRLDGIDHAIMAHPPSTNRRTGVIDRLTCKEWLTWAVSNVRWTNNVEAHARALGVPLSGPLPYGVHGTGPLELPTPADIDAWREGMVDAHLDALDTVRGWMRPAEEMEPIPEEPEASASAPAASAPAASASAAPAEQPKRVRFEEPDGSSDEEFTRAEVQESDEEGDLIERASKRMREDTDGVAESLRNAETNDAAESSDDGLPPPVQLRSFWGPPRHV